MIALGALVPRRGSTSILRRLLIGLALTVGGSTAIVATIFAFSVGRSEDAELHRNIESSTQEIAGLLESSLWDVDLDRAERIGEAFAQDPRVVRLTIRESGGETRTIERGAHGATVTRTRVVQSHGQPVGEVALTFSRAPYTARVREQVRVAVGVGVIALLATLAGVALLVRRVLRRPLSELATVVEAYSAGDYSPRATATPHTEFEPVYRVLDVMGERILGQLDDLHATNEALALEVQERRNAEAALRRRNRELAALNRFLGVAAASLETDALLDAACLELCALLDTSACYAATCDARGTSVTIVAEHVTTHGRSLLGTSLPLRGALRTLVDGRQPIASVDVATDERLGTEAARLAANDVASLLGVPAVVGDSTAAAIVLTSATRRVFTDDEITLALGIVAHAAGAIARERARAAEHLLRTVIEQIPESVMITDTEGRTVYVNTAFTKVTGYSADEMLGQSPRMLARGGYDDPANEAVAATLRAGHMWVGRLERRRKNGDPLLDAVMITPVRDDRGVVTHYVGVGRDVTLEIEQQERVRHAQRLEAVGQLAGGVAHDFNNILQAVLMQVEELAEHHHLAAPATRIVHDIGNSAKRAAALTRQLLVFSRRQPMQVKPHDLNAIVAELLRMLTRIIGEGITVTFVRSPVPVVFEGDAGMIEQVLLNLAVNARDAMPNGGTLTITTRLESRDDLPGRLACLEVRDTGIGMDEETQRRLFEPFFTTKDVGKGTGLGLATAHGIVTQHHGWISVESEVGRGTTFRVYIPALEGAPGATVGAPSSEPRRGDATILVVEDEPLVRDMVVRALGRLGYTVLEAGSAREAKRVWATEGERVDLVLTDMVMPDGASGLALALELRAARPSLEIIVMSGYSTELADDGAGDHEVRFLSKPFPIATLSETVRSALAQSAERRA